MTEQPKDQVCLDPQNVISFAICNAPPVAILNHASSLHSRLIYCDAAVSNLFMIAEVCGTSENHEVSTMAAVFLNQLEPLSRLLASMVSEEWISDRGNAVGRD